MTEYIELEIAKRFFANIDAGRSGCSTLLTPTEFAEYLDEIEPADVAPVRHGKWEEYGVGVCCTNCGVSLFHQDENNNFGIEPTGFMYCPHCGARMDGDTHG